MRALRVCHNQPLLFASFAQVAAHFAPRKLCLALEVGSDHFSMVIATFKLAVFIPLIFRIEMGQKNRLNSILRPRDDFDSKRP